MAFDESENRVCSPGTWIALRRRCRATGEWTDQLNRMENGHHGDLQYSAPQKLSSRKSRGPRRPPLARPCSWDRGLAPKWCSN